MWPVAVWSDVAVASLAFAECICPLSVAHTVGRHCTLCLLWLGSCFAEWLQQDCCKKGGRELEAVTCETAPAEVSVDTFHACSAGHCKWGGHRRNHSHHSTVSTVIPNICTFELLLLAVLASIALCTVFGEFWVKQEYMALNSILEEIIRNYQPKLLQKFVLNNESKLVCMYTAHILFLVKPSEYKSSRLTHGHLMFWTHSVHVNRYKNPVPTSRKGLHVLYMYQSADAILVRRLVSNAASSAHFVYVAGE